MEGRIKFLRIIKGKAWFSVGEKAVALDDLGTNTFFDRDIKGLNDLYAMHWGFQMDFNNSLHVACEKAAEVHNLINREMVEGDIDYDENLHVSRMEDLVKSIREEADLMLALRAAIHVLENNPPIFVEAHIDPKDREKWNERRDD